MSSPSNTTDSSTVTAVVSLGSNLASSNRSPEQLVRSAMGRLRRISVQARASSLYRSEPLDCPAGASDFINAVMVLQLPASISAHSFLAMLQDIEADFDRRRGAQPNQDRTLDLDLISYENQILESNDLTLPHPRASQRRFVLQPLAEIDPHWVLPGQAASTTQLLAQISGQENVQRIP